MWPTNEVYVERRAASTIERVEKGICALGEGKDFLVVYYGTDKAGGWQSLDKPLRDHDARALRRDPVERQKADCCKCPRSGRGMGLPERFKLSAYRSATLDLGFVAMELALLVAPDAIRPAVARYASPSIIGTLNTSAALLACR